MLHHFLFWTLKWLMTVIAGGTLVNMVKTVNRPLATRSIVATPNIGPRARALRTALRKTQGE